MELGSREGAGVYVRFLRSVGWKLGIMCEGAFGSPDSVVWHE